MTTEENTTNKEKLIEFILNLSEEEVEVILSYLKSNS